MKKLLILTLALLLALFCFSACNEHGGEGAETGETTAAGEYNVEAAKAFLKNMYKHLLTANQTPADYTLVSQVMNNGAVYTIDWTVDNEAVKVTVDEANKQATVDVNEKAEADTPYKLTATITAPDGTTATLEFDLVVPAFRISSYEDYYAAEAGDAVVVEGIVVAIHSQQEGNKYNQLYVMDANGVGGYYVYSMGADPVADLGLKLGMTVTVTGTKDIYNGLHEVKDATVAILDATEKELTPVDITEAFAGAADLKDPNLVNKLGMFVTIKGVEITTQDTSEKSQYYKFRLGGLETYIRVYATDCPASVSDADMQTIISSHAEHKGWAANVSGVVVVYNGAIYLNPISVNCFEYLNLIERTPAEMLQVEKDSIKVPSALHMDTVLELPVKGETYGDVTITWSSANENVVVDNATGKISVFLAKEATTVKLTATLTIGEETLTSDYEIALDAAPTVVPKPVTSDFKADVAYKFYVMQGNLGTILYLDGGVDRSYLTTTKDITKALDFYLETADGGYCIYTKIGDLKQYLQIFINADGYTAVRYNEEGSVFAYDASCFCWKTTVDGTEYYLGIYNNFETVSASKTSYINPDNTRKAQFPAELVELVDISSMTDADKVAAELPNFTLSKTDFTLDGTMVLPVRGTVYTDVVVTWVSDNASVVVNGSSLTVTLTDKAQTAKLTATVTCGDVTETVEYTLTLGSKVTLETPEDIVNAAYGLGVGETLADGQSFTLTGIITSVDTDYSSQYGNVTVTIQVGNLTDKLMKCYRLQGDGADVIKVGDTITVTGIIKNYNGTIEFDAKCTLDAYTPGAGTDTPETPDTPEVPAETDLKVGTAYYLYGVNAKGTIYFNGTISNGRIGATTNASAAVALYLESAGAAGEYYLYYMDGNTKTYVTAIEDKSAGFGTSTSQSAEGVWLISTPDAGVISKALGDRGIATQNGSNYDNFSTYATVNFSTAEYTVSWFVEPGNTPEIPDAGEDEEPETPDAPAALNPVKPVPGTAYKFAFINENKGTDIYYMTGSLSGYYMASSLNASEGADFYVEETDGGYYVYCMVGGAKKYLNMVVSGTYVNAKFEDAASTVYTYSHELQTMVAVVNGTDYIHATRNDNTYTTLGPVKVSYDPFYAVFVVA